jgi:hypothetical protein
VDVYKSIANIEDLVETETSAGDVDKSKPHADVFTAFQRAFSSSPRVKLIVGGDTPYELKPPASWLEQAGCCVLYHDPAGLELYEQSPIAAN